MSDGYDRWFPDHICTHLIVLEGKSIVNTEVGKWSDYEVMMQAKFGKDLSPHHAN